MRHQDLLLNHRLESFVYADAAARTAATGFATADRGRIAYQQDNGTYWRLTAEGPPAVWAAIVTVPTIPVASVFGRTGAVVAATNDYTWAQIGSKPLYASLQQASSIPATITGSAAKMLGLAATITPGASGKLLATLTVGVFYTTGGVYFSQLNIRYGTVASGVPANNAVVPGASTQIGPQMQGVANPYTSPLTITALVTLTPGTAYWFDGTVAGSNVAAVTHADNSAFTIVELP